MPEASDPRFRPVTEEMKTILSEWHGDDTWTAELRAIREEENGLYKGKTAKWWAEGMETQTARLQAAERMLAETQATLREMAEKWEDAIATIAEVRSHIDHPSNKGMVSTTLIRSILDDYEEPR